MINHSRGEWVGPGSSYLTQGLILLYTLYTPRKLAVISKMMVWKRWFLLNRAIVGIYVWFLRGIIFLEEWSLRAVPHEAVKIDSKSACAVYIQHFCRPQISQTSSISPLPPKKLTKQHFKRKGSMNSNHRFSGAILGFSRRVSFASCLFLLFLVSHPWGHFSSGHRIVSLATWWSNGNFLSFSRNLVHQFDSSCNLCVCVS